MQQQRANSKDSVDIENPESSHVDSVTGIHDSSLELDEVEESDVTPRCVPPSRIRTMCIVCTVETLVGYVCLPFAQPIVLGTTLYLLRPTCPEMIVLGAPMGALLIIYTVQLWSISWFTPSPLFSWDTFCFGMIGFAFFVPTAFICWLFKWQKDRILETAEKVGGDDDDFLLGILGPSLEDDDSLAAPLLSAVTGM